MTVEIVRRDQSAALPEKMEWARVLATSAMLPRAFQGNPGNLLFAAEYADALGIAPIHATTSIHVIEGRPSASADLIAHLIRRAGHKLRVTGDDTHAVAQLIRADDPDFTFEARWDLDKAKAANLLGKSVWRSYPAAMLRSRAVTEVARMGASDALFGVIYTPEELGAEVDAAGSVVHSVTQVGNQPQTAPPPGGAERVRDVIGARRQQPAAQPTAAAGEEPAAPRPAAGPEPITPAQVKKLAVAMGEAGLTDRAAALGYVAEVIGRTVESRNDLTKDEASRLIDRLEQEPVDAEVVPEEPTAAESPADTQAHAAPAPSTATTLDGDAVWAQLVDLAQERGWTPADLQDDFAKQMGGVTAGSATAEELQHYLVHHLQGGAGA